MYHHILVGTDGSPTATRAVEAAARLAHAHRAKLTIVHAFQPRRFVPPDDATFAPRELQWQMTGGALADSIVQAAADQAQLAACGGLRVETRVKAGNPSRVLLELSRSLRADAVVVGNADIHRALVGRSVHQVLTRRAGTEVVVIDTRSRAA